MKALSREENEELVIELRFDKHDQLCLNHDLVDILDWYAKGPSSEKIKSCQKRMINECQHLIMSDPSLQSLSVKEMNEMLNDPLKMVQAIASHPSYQNRKAREQSLESR